MFYRKTSNIVHSVVIVQPYDVLRSARGLFNIHDLLVILVHTLILPHTTKHELYTHSCSLYSTHKILAMVVQTFG